MHINHVLSEEILPYNDNFEQLFQKMHSNMRLDRLDDLSAL